MVTKAVKTKDERKVLSFRRKLSKSRRGSNVEAGLVGIYVLNQNTVLEVWWCETVKDEKFVLR